MTRRFDTNTFAERGISSVLNTLSRVEILSWLLWPVFTLTLLFFVLTLTVGAASVWPSRWNEKLRAVGEAEIARRFEHRPTRSQRDHIAAERLLGAKPESAKPEAEAERETVILDVVGVMINASDRAQLDAELRERRDQLERSALGRQIRLVAHVSNFTIASHLWAASRSATSVAFSLYGLIWFLPRTLPHITKVNEKTFAAATLSGVVAGILLAGPTLADFPRTASAGWLAIVGNAMAFGAIAALVFTMTAFLKALITTRFGEVRQWTARGATLGIVLLVVISAMLYLSLSGDFGRWQNDFARHVQHLDLSTKAAHWIGGLLLLAMLTYMIRNAWLWVRLRTVRLSDRFWSAAALLFLAFIGMTLVLFMLEIPTASASWFFKGSAWAIITVALAAVIASIVEWAQNYRALTRAGWPVKRKGFRWWALIAWGVAGVVLTTTLPLVSATSTLAANTVAHQVCSLLYGLLFLTWGVALCPGIVITALYVRRVNAAHRDVMHLGAPDHPYLRSTTALP